MKNRKIYYFLIAGILAVTLFLFLNPKQEIGTEQKVESRSQPKQKLQDSEEESQSARVQTSNPPNDKELTYEERLNQWKEFSLKGNMPVTFYGKVIDQNGQPISNVKVDYRVSKVELGSGRTESAYDIYSDSNGSFEINQGKGLVLLIKKFEKEGYKAKRNTGGSFTYGRFYGGRHKPDRNNPVVFNMWEKGETEPLVKGDKFYGIKPDGRKYTIDFITSKKIENKIGGDITVKINRPIEVPDRSNFDWSMTITVNSGGIVRTDDAFLYEAPQDGYQQSYSIDMKGGSKDWVRDLKNAKFYVKSRNGDVYSSFTVNVLTLYNDQSVFDVKWLSNPNGSRNLEYDPAKDVTKQYVRR